MEITPRESKRFWGRVIKTDTCWLWTGKPHRDNQWGYGRFHAAGQSFKAHRLSYILAYGSIPDGLLVRHKCDNPLCVRPDHLLLGTDLDNVQDCIDRGRRPIGERVGSATLSDSEVVHIRSLYEVEHWHQARIAREYGVSRRTINRIVRHLSRT